MRAATCSERTNPICIRNLARLTFCHDQLLARHRSPLYIRSTRASSAINAMTINQCSWLTLQHIPCSTTNAPTSDFHTIHLPEQMNYEIRNTGTTVMVFLLS